MKHIVPTYLQTFLLFFLMHAGVCFSPATLQAQSTEKQALAKGQFIPVPWAPPPPLHARAEVLYAEHFEGAAPGWTAPGDWAIGTPTSGPASCIEGQRCAGTGLGAPYGNDANFTLMSPRIALTGSSEATFALRFDEWFMLETGFDFGNTWISTDDGASWVEIGLFRTGFGSWRKTEVDLTAFAGMEVRLGFNITTDESITEAGWFIDQVEVIRTEAAPLSTALVGIADARFPWVYLNATVRALDAPVQNLSAGNFTVFENGVAQTDGFEVVPPLVNGGVRLVDVVFLLDNSGSMATTIDAVRANVRAFADNLAARQIDLALGLATFRDTALLLSDGVLVRDLNLFDGFLASINAVGGGGREENAFGALSLAAQRFLFRPGSRRIFILLTDAPSLEDNPNVTPPAPDQADLIARLQAASITCYAAAPEHPHFQGPESVTGATSGQFYNLEEGLESLWRDVVGRVANTYVLRYRAADRATTGTPRALRLEVQDGPERATATGLYTPGPLPLVQRTPETIALEQSAHPAGQAISIEADVTQGSGGPLEEVHLMYRMTASAAGYRRVAMQRLSGNRYRGAIPAADVQPSGVRYYIAATDGGVTTTAPRELPNAQPYTLAVLPNEPPEVRHVPVTIAPEGLDMPIGVYAKDVTNRLIAVTLFQRAPGQIRYTSRAIPEVGADSFAVILPVSERPAEGFAYYIRVEDNLRIHQYIGYPDAPIEVVQGEAPPATRLVSPDDGAGNLPLPVTLAWAGNPEALSFDLSYATDPAFQDEQVVQVSDPPFLLGTLQHATAYYWRVRVNTPGGRSAWSKVRRFTTQLAVPQPVYPLDADLVPHGRIRLQWEGVRGAVQYAVTFATDPTFTTILGTGTVRTPSWAVVPPRPHRSYYWRVQALGPEGETSAWSAPLLFVPYTGRPDDLAAETDPAGGPGKQELVPTQYGLAAAYPNPFQDRLSIRYALPEAAGVWVGVYDVLGREVQTLVGGVRQEAGWYTVPWAGTDAAGRPVAEGVYLIRMQAGSFQAVRGVIRQ